MLNLQRNFETFELSESVQCCLILRIDFLKDDQFKFHWISPLICPVPFVVLSTYLSVALLPHSGSFIVGVPFFPASICSMNSSTSPNSFLKRDFHGSSLSYQVISCPWSVVHSQQSALCLPTPVMITHCPGCRDEHVTQAQTISIFFPLHWWLVHGGNVT